MSTTIKNVKTLDIQFHTLDGTTMGSSYTWKFNNPSANVTTLQDVKDAFGMDGGNDGWFGVTLHDDYNVRLYDSAGNEIDGIDGAKITEVVTTKTDLS